LRCLLSQLSIRLCAAAMASSRVPVTLTTDDRASASLASGKWTVTGPLIPAKASPDFEVDAVVGHTSGGPLRPRSSAAWRAVRSRQHSEASAVWRFRLACPRRNLRSSAARRRQCSGSWMGEDNVGINVSPAIVTATSFTRSAIRRRTPGRTRMNAFANRRPSALATNSST
jgi:hypothetical protein